MRRIIYFVSFLTVIGICASCGGKKKAAEQKQAETTETKAPAAKADPRKTAEGPYETLVAATADCPAYVIINKPQVDLSKYTKDKDGYYIIFDGKTFNGWRGNNRDGMPGRWVIDNGTMKCNGSGTGEGNAKDGGDILFEHKFKNFEIRFDWKIAKKGNSGFFYLAQEIKGEPLYISAPEYQLLDSDLETGHDDAKMGKNGNRRAASLYDMIPAKPQNSKPAEQWNQGGVRVNKGTVTHIQNGQNVVEYHLWTPAWTDMLNAGKFAKDGQFPLAFALLNNLGGEKHEGYIGFQDHGDDVWIRNVRIKVLD